MWHVTDIAWPTTPDVYDACVKNVQQFLLHGVRSRHVRRCDTDQFLGCGLVGPFLRFICGQKEVDIPELARLVAEAGLRVIFIGEYTCGQSRHCLRRALVSRTRLHRMLCDRPWERLPEPRRGWKRGSGDVWSLIEFREDARDKVRKRHAADRLQFSELHSANNWRNALSRGRAGVSDYGHTMWPAV